MLFLLLLNHQECSYLHISHSTVTYFYLHCQAGVISGIFWLYGGTSKNETVSLVVCFAEKYFMNVTCFLLFNFCAMCGSLIAGVIQLVLLSLELLIT